MMYLKQWVISLLKTYVQYNIDLFKEKLKYIRFPVLLLVPAYSSTHLFVT